MKILVLGGTGAMGVPLVKILAERGHDVSVTSRKRRESAGSLRYIEGNAHNEAFLKGVLKEGWDAIVNFMSYPTAEFESVADLLLSSCGHYFFLSSARAYADSSIIKEDSPRLLDAPPDAAYIKTDEYALAKAREENALFSSARRNWTIIRPYITFNDERLQLGTLEKEAWLQRALEGKTIVFSRDVAARLTTLTWGYDVSIRIAALIESGEGMGQAFHITADRAVRWEDVLQAYLDTLEKVLGKRPAVLMLDDLHEFYGLGVSRPQVEYDRLYNRVFDNSKIKAAAPGLPPFAEPIGQLKRCLEAFLAGPRSFRGRNWLLEGVMDKKTGDVTRLSDIEGRVNKMKYLAARRLPRFALKALLRALGTLARARNALRRPSHSTE